MIYNSRAEAVANGEQIVHPVRRLTDHTNIALRRLQRRWRIDGDWMTCRSCSYNIVASRIHEKAQHASDCKTPNEPNPWVQLRAILNGEHEPK